MLCGLTTVTPNTAHTAMRGAVGPGSPGNTPVVCHLHKYGRGAGSSHAHWHITHK